MPRDLSNLRNQPKKVEEVEKTVEETEATEAELELKAELEEKAEEATESNTAEAKGNDESFVEIYFVNSNTKNLSTMVGDFVNGVFVAKTEEEAEGIRKTEDFKWGFVKEMSKKEFEKSQ